MKMDRRQALKAAALTGGAASLAGCTDRMVSGLNKMLGEDVPRQLAVAQGAEIDPEFHLLSRAAFGPWPGDVEQVKKMGRDAWLEEQLHPERIDDTLCDFRANRFESLFFSEGDAYEFRKPVLREELTRHALIRAIYSKRQLFEVMVEFWSDHLNIDLEKGDCIYLKPSDDRDVIRKHALGGFHDLIRASATSAAMLTYLDGRSNKVTKSGEKPNENYARELMELHTMGARGGYTQDDVLEAARCLSGWTVDLNVKFGQAMNPFRPARGVPYFNKSWHDDGEKRVLGQTITAHGRESDLDKLVSIVCDHPSTAQFLATKLCRRFVSAEPPPPLVSRVAAEFTKTKGDIKSLLRVILKSDEFATSRGQLLKRPFKFLVSALRATAADTHADKSVLEPLQRMGHGLFQYPTPDGYPDEELPWMGTLMWRWNFSLALAGGKQPGARVNLTPLIQALREKKKEPDAATWFGHLVGRKPTQQELAAIAVPVPTKKDASPEYAAESKQTVGLILASPAFQRC